MIIVFCSATGFQNILQKNAGDLYVIIRLEKVPLYRLRLGLHAPEDSIIMLEKKRGIEVLFVCCNQPRQRLEAIHLILDLTLKGSFLIDLTIVLVIF
ncbi:MAG: hypothetical protein IPO69_02475 [Saprospiraceae bacterium]|nr:hypothetical protein [Saprospiraceae bacterium]